MSVRMLSALMLAIHFSVNQPITTGMFHCNSTDAKRDKRNREATKPNMEVFWGYRLHNIFLTSFLTFISFSHTVSDDSFCFVLFFVCLFLKQQQQQI